jgi:signal transduction histidine kinase
MHKTCLFVIAVPERAQVAGRAGFRIVFPHIYISAPDCNFGICNISFFIASMLPGRPVDTHRKSPALKYSASILAFMVALALRVLGKPILENDAPFLFFFSALALAAWYGGLGPGILATLLGAVAAAVLFLPPITREGILEFNHILHIAVFIATGVFVSVLMKQLHGAIDRSAKAERELENRVQERTVQLAEANLELEAEKNKLTAILDLMREAVYIVNPQFEIEYTNPAMERAFGTIQGQKCFQYLNGPDAAVCSRCRNPEILEGNYYFQEWTSPKNNRVYDCFETAIFIQNGVQCKLKIMHDITGLKKAEEELLSKHQQIQRLSSELLTAQETERMRISRELHDEFGQSLTLIKLKIGMVEMNLPESQQSLKVFCDDASSHVDRTIENMRRLSRDLSPMTVEALGITSALEDVAEDFSRTGRIQITADIDGIDNILSLQYNILLYRVLQEGLNNIIKHSGADVAHLSVKRRDGGIYFELTDNGKGFDLEKDNRGEGAIIGGFGLTTMGERVRTLGGALTIQSRKDEGTKLYFMIPIGNK